VLDAALLQTTGSLSTADEPAYFITNSWNGRLAALTLRGTGVNVKTYGDDCSPLSNYAISSGEASWFSPTIVISGDGSQLLSGTFAQGHIRAVN
jgi:hypothetical protein